MNNVENIYIVMAFELKIIRRINTKAKSFLKQEISLMFSILIFYEQWKFHARFTTENID